MGRACSGKAFVEGNIREESLADIWYKPGAFAYNREWSIDDLEGFCKTCRHVMRCRGGCRGKMVASGGGVENTMCVHRIACEEGHRKRVAQVAAVALASVLGGTATACQDSDDDPGDAGDTAELDAGDDSDGTGGGLGTAAPVYGMPDETTTDTDSETTAERNTEMVALYAMPIGTDTGALPPYGMPEEIDTDTRADIDTEAVDVYAMPLYAMQEE